MRTFRDFIPRGARNISVVLYRTGLDELLKVTFKNNEGEFLGAIEFRTDNILSSDELELFRQAKAVIGSWDKSDHVVIDNGKTHTWNAVIPSAVFEHG